MRKVVWIIILLALLVSVMSFMYLFDGVNEGYLELKSKEVLKSRLWWIQFSKRMHTTYVKWHRTLGKIYVVMTLLCAISGFYIGFFATGGWIPATGFIAMALKNIK